MTSARRIAPNVYARAFLAAVREGADVSDAADNLIELLQGRGDGARALDVLHAVNVLLIQEKGGRIVRIETARELDGAHERALRASFNASDEIETAIVPELVAGTRILVDGERELDVSLAGALTSLFA